MNAKEIGRRAGRIFQNAIPANWAYRPQEDQEDYGIDGEIELVDEQDHATGFIFKAQIKGQESVSIIEEGRTVSFNIRCDKLLYYMKQIEVPIILVVVDVTTENLYWRTLQGDEKLSTALESAVAKGQASLSVHLDANRQLSGNTQIIIKDVEKNMDWLRLHAIKRLSQPVKDMLQSHSEKSLEELMLHAKKIVFQLRVDKFQRLYKEENFGDLYKQSHEILISPSETVNERFCAAFYLEKVHLRCHEFQSDEHRAANFDLYLYLIGLARPRSTPIHLKLLSILLLLSLRLRLFVEQDYHFYITTEHTKSDPIASWVVSASRTKIAFRTAREVDKTIRVVNRFITRGYFTILPDIIPRVLPLISLFAKRLHKEGLEEQASLVIEWAEFCLGIALEVASSIDEQSYFPGLIVLKASLAHKSDSVDGNIKECLILADKIIDLDIKSAVLKKLDEIKSRKDDEAEELSPEEEIKYFKERAKALGINVDDSEDEFGRIIAQGLKDYNPERALKNCRHLLFVPSSAQGVPARMVGLPSAAMKYLHCLKKGFTVGGWSLDDLYESPIPEFGFKGSHCKGCPDLEPMPEDWRWSSKWQQEMHNKYRELFNKMDSW